MKIHSKIRIKDSFIMLLWIVSSYVMIYGIIYMILGVQITPFTMVLLALIACEKYHRKIN